MKDIRRYSDQILKDTKRIERIIEEILSFSKDKSRGCEPVDLHKTINDACDSFTERVKEKKTSIRVRLQKKPVVLSGNSDDLRRIFNNLISNALDAISEGGKVNVTTKLEKNQVLVEVADDGNGISKENLSKLFTPFFTTKSKGTGLGLSIIKKIIDDHNGRIKVKSREGVGTTFMIYLPLNTPPIRRA